MTDKEFEKTLEERLSECRRVLGVKAGEYALGDRLHNFKQAAVLQGISPLAALGGMMAKHTVSVYDCIRRTESGEELPKAMWEEKIGDHINYLLLLWAMVEEAEKNKTESSNQLWGEEHIDD